MCDKNVNFSTLEMRVLKLGIYSICLLNRCLFAHIYAPFAQFIPLVEGFAGFTMVNVMWHNING